MISFNIILPELNSFITNLGGEDYKGLIFLLFAITAAISRPFSGKLADTIGRKKVMFIGVLISVIVTLFYPVTGLASFLLLRLMHGFSAGFLPTGATALVTDILPAHKRGVGMGIRGTFISVGMGSGQVVASWITINWGINALFLTGALFAVLTGLLIGFVSESLPQPQKFKFEFLKIKWNDVLEPNVLPAAFVMFCSAISTGLVFVITPDISVFLDIDNKGWFFGFYMISTIVIRLFGSGISDKIGRRKTLVFGLSFMVASMSLIALSTTVMQYTIGAIVFGMSTGVSSPTLFAWTADLSSEDRRGVGAGTLFIALEVGIMVGSFSTMWTYDNTINSLPYVFFFGAFFSIVAIGFLLWHLSNRESKT